MKPVYIGFDGRKDIESQYRITLNKDAKILLAVYECGSYEGDSFVLFMENGMLYETNGSHCSCHGLEGQWEPELTDVSSLRHRLENGTLGSHVSGQRDILDKILIKLDKDGFNAAEGYSQIVTLKSGRVKISGSVYAVNYAKTILQMT